MKIIFFGSGKFGVATLEALIKERHDIALVVTRPDRQKGRRLLFVSTPIKECAAAHRLEVFDPEDPNTSSSIEIFKKKNPDIFIVVSYGKILSRDVLVIPKYLAMNIHASLLPRYRGASPINRALMDGARTTGISFIRMNEFMDRGDIVAEKSVAIDENDNAVSLEEKLSQEAAASVGDILTQIENGRTRFTEQDNTQASYAPLLKREDGLIRWDSDPKEIRDRFRGCYGWPGTFAYFKGDRVKILDLEIGKGNILGAGPGKIINIEDACLEIACRGGSILVKEIQLESRAKMPIKSFLSGHHVNAGDSFGP